MAEWQPIETAPKPAKMILLYCPNRNDAAGDVFSKVFSGYWYDGNDTTSGAPCWTCGAWDSSFEDMIACEPTHWMPLPAPPKDRKNTQGDGR